MGASSAGVTPTTRPFLTFRSKLQPVPQKGQVVRTFVTSHGRVPTKCLLIRAPVGQAATHCPHIRQISRSMGRSKDVVTVEFTPRPTKSTVPVT